MDIIIIINTLYIGVDSDTSTGRFIKYDCTYIHIILQRKQVVHITYIYVQYPVGLIAKNRYSTP